MKQPPCPRRSLPCRAGLVLALALAGCATAPEPDSGQIRADALGTVAIPPNWSAQASQAQVDRGWLAAFADPQLTALVHEALARNPDLLIAAARVEQANAQVDIAQAQLRPTLGLIGRGGSKPVADLVPLLSGLMLRLSWEIDLWGRLRYARNAAVAASDAQNADYRYAQQSLAASVARAWFTASEARLQHALASDMAAAGEQLAELAAHRERIGAGSANEVLAARANAATYLDAQQQAEMATRSAARALEILLGRYPGATLQAPVALTPLPGAVPAGIPIDVLNRRPDLYAAERRVAAAFDRVGEARAAMLPTLSLSAGYGRLSNLQGVGFSMDQSLQTLSDKLRGAIPVLGREIHQANVAYMHGRTRAQSLRRLGESFDDEDLRSLVQLMLQVHEHGGAVQEPLKQFSLRLREHRRATLKEKVGKLSVKMTVVMMLTLLPALMLVLSGPAIIALADAMTRLGS